jgi:hypothetical protein
MKSRAGSPYENRFAWSMRASASWGATMGPLELPECQQILVARNDEISLSRPCQSEHRIIVRVAAHGLCQWLGFDPLRRGGVVPQHLVGPFADHIQLNGRYAC